MSMEKLPTVDDDPLQETEPGHDPNRPPAEDISLEKHLDADVKVETGDGLDTEDDSIYPEVRASVPPSDSDVPANTFRGWVLGVVATLLLSGMQQLFELHNPPISISSYVMILLVYPVGCFAAYILPRKKFSFFGRQCSLNPGPFNPKEHALIAIMTIGSSGYDSGSVASDVWTALVKLLDIPVSAGYRFMFLLVSQGLSFGVAGLIQRIVVDPAFCIWPGTLPTCSFIYGIHDRAFQNKVVAGWKMSRMRFFTIVLIAATLYEFLPGYLFTGLTTFAWITWIAPNNVALNQVFGATTGMDLLPMTLDWNQVTPYLGSPLVVPTWAIMNIACAAVFILWILSPALHWSNHWNGKYFPFSSSDVFDNTGSEYNVSRVLTDAMTLDESAYHDYSPVFMSTTSILSYGLGLGSITAIVIHSALNHRLEVWEGLKATFWRKDAPPKLAKEDVHTKLMNRYQSTPTWWYAVSLLIMFILAIVFVEYFNTGLPWWGVLLSLIINLVLIIPIAIMMAICNQSVSLNIFSALIGGFIWPGKMVAVVIFKILTFNTTGNALVLLGDQKLGHYMKIPPRTVFVAQAVGILVNWLAQTAVNIWALANVDGICTGEAEDNFLCPLAQSYESSIVFWGLIGPQKLFSSGALYNSMLYFFLLGALLPVLVYVGARRFPSSFLRNIHVPLVMSATSAIPPATASNYFPWAIVGLTFNYYIKKQWRAWWLKYNFILAVGLDAGLAIATLLIFLCLSYPGVVLDWWGNNIADMTADGMGLPLLTVSEGKTIGPSTWA